MRGGAHCRSRGASTAFGLGGRAARLASWSRVSANATYVLSVDPDGAVWVAASPARAPVHVVARLAVVPEGDAAYLAGWRVGPGRLLPGGARADDAGLTVVTELVPGRAPRVRHHPAASLLRAPGGERECF